ncbi:hypothetical protein CK203_057353 [Vitis vinifera]|uniref:PGG domain-containing protein n=1 Tax=Vitis vinifera TaxID=29760 RepID=A0A438GLW5_VITVI|nr:hypothetical protein CK203_057353 [Vitis vinifera]
MAEKPSSFWEKETKRRERKKERKEYISQLQKQGETHLIVSALITTVTFAAGFTLPGGYKEDDGQAILSKKAAFSAFVVTDTIAMVSSLCAVFVHFLMTLHKRGKYLEKHLLWAFSLTMVGMGAMAIAFATGLYAVLPHSSGLSVLTCILCSCFFLSIAVEYCKFWRAKCHPLSRPRVTSLVAIRNQPRFLKLQKEVGRKGGYRGAKTEKVAAGGIGQTEKWPQKEFSRKKVAAAENVGKANSRDKKEKKQRRREDGNESRKKRGGKFFRKKGRNSLRVQKSSVSFCLRNQAFSHFAPMDFHPWTSNYFATMDLHLWVFKIIATIGLHLQFGIWSQPCHLESPFGPRAWSHAKPGRPSYPHIPSCTPAAHSSLHHRVFFTSLRPTLDILHP